MELSYNISTALTSAADVSTADIINSAAAAGESGGFLSGTDMPLWAMLMMPKLWWITLPLILIVACAASVIALRICGEQWMWKDMLKKSAVRMFFVHSLSLLLSSGFMLFWGFVPAFFSEWWDEHVFVYICSNPWGSFFSLIFVLLAGLLAFSGMYFLDLRYSFRKHDKIDDDTLKRIAFYTALLSAPYIYLMPFTLRFS